MTWSEGPAPSAGWAVGTGPAAVGCALAELEAVDGVGCKTAPVPSTTRPPATWITRSAMASARVVLVGREHNGTTGCLGACEKLVEKITTLLVEPGVGFVQEPEPGAPSHEHGERGPALLSGRAPPYCHGRETPAETELLEHCSDARLSCPRRPHGEAQVLLHGQLVVEKRLVTEHADLAPHPAPVCHQVAPEHRRLSRVHGNQAGEHLQQAGLACPIRPAQMHHLALADFQGSSCEEGKPAGQRYGLVETNSRRH